MCKINPKIIRELHVVQHIDPKLEVDKRVQFLLEYIDKTSTNALILGISGGIDSFVAGRICQIAIDKFRFKTKKSTKFIAMRLPYGLQIDGKIAEEAISIIKPDQVLTFDIKPASDIIINEIEKEVKFSSIMERDYVLGNIKARQRMVIQYAISNAYNGLVIGTDHASEALVGFFTKFGDGAADLMPLFGLNKRQIRSIAKFLLAPQSILNKIPTADLESCRPLLPDEEVLGVTYEEIDDFLEGKEINHRAFEIIKNKYLASAHKRSFPKTIFST